MNAIDLFAGCGGLSKGFMDAGFKIIVGVDNDEAALETFKLNHNGAIPLKADLSQQNTFDEIKRLAGKNNIDVIIAGPPCQGFSLTGPRHFDDKRNKLYLAVFEVVKQFQPKGFIIENVPGMATLYDGQIKNEILRRFKKLGYNVKCKILCAADYGVPQIRKRLIFMGIREDIGYPVFPDPILTPDKYVTCRQALSDLPSRNSSLGEEVDSYTKKAETDYQKLMRKKSCKLYNHVASEHSELVKYTISLVPEGGNYKDLPKGVGESRKFHVAWTRYNGNKPSNTIDTGHRNHFHYEYNRVPTVRENARLQSFPDNFRFLGTRTQQNRQVGNAVPPLLGYHLGLQLKAIIAGKIKVALQVFDAELPDLFDDKGIDIINSVQSENVGKKVVNTIDLFAGCGGLTEGFKESGFYNTLACVEWEKAPCDNLRNNLKSKWKYSDADERVLRFDIQRTNELLKGWKNDHEYGSSKGMDYIVKKNGGSVDLIIGGPPCQAYSIAGRIRDKNGMRDDYRNFLFESYIRIVKHYKPKAFIFENVPGMLSARPGDGKELIVDIIKKEFLKAGYDIIPDLNDAVIDFTQYGVPQRRSRVIIIGLRRSSYGKNSAELIKKFYTEILPSHKVKIKRTVRDAIGDLPKLYPLAEPMLKNGRRYSHSLPNTEKFANHEARYNSRRDIEIFKMLARDIESKKYQYVSTETLKELYESKTGKSSNVHKYYVLRWDEQSNTIPAHLYKDGLRHIHPDSKQARSITVREAARLQTFPDDYIFISGLTDNYKMIGNAVPPLFAKVLAESIFELLFLK